MAAQKRKKIVGRNLLYFECLLTENPTNLNSLDPSRSNGRLYQNPKTGASRELFLPGGNFKTSSTVNFLKKTKKYKNWFGHLMGTYSKCKYCGRNSKKKKKKKKSAEKTKKLNFNNFLNAY